MLENKNNRNILPTCSWLKFFCIMVLAVLLGFLVGCEGPVPTDLDRAAKVVKYMSRKDVLAHTSFTKKYPHGKPTDFVRWFLSKEGRAQWPASLDNSDSNPEIRRKAYEKGAPIVPLRMSFLSNNPDPEKGRQLVITADDNRRLIIVEGYADSSSPPALVREWELPDLENE